MMARVLLGFCALGAADGLSLNSQHVMASNQTARVHHSSHPSPAFVESQVLAALDSGAQAPFDDLLSLLTTMKKRYLCENADAGHREKALALVCDAAEASLSAISDKEGRKLTTKTNECEAGNSAIIEKKKQIQQSTTERKTANDKIPGYIKIIKQGTSTDTTAAKTFVQERKDANGAIKLVKDMAEKSTTLTLVQMAQKVESLPEGAAKNMGSLALLEMKEAKGFNGDTAAYKDLLEKLRQELAKYLLLLTNTEGTRASAWVTAKAGFEKDLKDAKDAVALQDSNLLRFGKELVSMESADKQCKKELVIQQETTKQAALDAENKAKECVSLKKSAKEASTMRTQQLSTVAELLKMLADSNIAAHVKEAVKTLNAAEVKDFECAVPYFPVIFVDAPTTKTLSAILATCATLSSKRAGEWRPVSIRDTAHVKWLYKQAQTKNVNIVVGSGTPLAYDKGNTGVRYYDLNDMSREVTSIFDELKSGGWTGDYDTNQRNSCKGRGQLFAGFGWRKTNIEDFGDCHSMNKVICEEYAAE